MKIVKEYYGADLKPFPPEVRKWIVNKVFSEKRIKQKYITNPKLNVMWSDDGNSVIAALFYTIAKGFKDAGKQTAGIRGKYSGDPVIFKKFGKYAKYQTLKFKWELRQEVDKMLATDEHFAEIVKFAKRLGEEIEYDWANFSAYKGAPVKKTPNKRYAVCAGYSDEVTQKALKLKSVKAVQTWTGPNHEWNVLKLIDGRTLYFDLTWFDNEDIDEKTGRIFKTEDYNWANITFNEELFRYSGIGYASNQFTHALGKFAGEVVK